MRIIPIRNLVFDQGLVLVLFLLCVFFSIFTIEEQSTLGLDGARLVFQELHAAPIQSNFLIASAQGPEEDTFASLLQQQMKKSGYTNITLAKGDPKTIRDTLNRYKANRQPLDFVLCSAKTAGYLVIQNLAEMGFPGSKVLSPNPYKWPNFLKRENLLNITNQISVIAILAIGMTMVVLTGGIDLSVGSLVALGAVISTYLIREFAGGREARLMGMTASSLAGIFSCGALGLLNGLLITKFKLPAFIVTLAMMLIANGLAFRMTDGESIYEIPDSFVWLGRGAEFFHIPNSAILMLLLYGMAAIIMNITVLGRYLYAVGGNAEASHRSGIHVTKVVILTYLASGTLAGLGGVILASQLKSASPNFGTGYELSVIAAVVVGGCSLSGGKGHVLGTLLGAFVIAVIQNGMNLMGINPFSQKIVLGFVILLAVLLDRWKAKIAQA
ncbi:MAG: ABC transporter permease [Gemmataceae bacterium]